MKKNRIILFIVAFIVWELLTWPPDGQHLAVGILVCSFVSWFTGDLFIRRPYILKSVRRYLWFFYFVPLFIWECIKANIDVAYLVIHPDLPIKPGIVKIKTNLKSDTALTFLANSITLTPGTMSVDIDSGKGILYIHWINVQDKDVEKASEIIAGKFERILSRIFD